MKSRTCWQLTADNTFQPCPGGTVVTRLLKQKEIPRTLWDARDDLLRLPGHLSEAYVAALEKRDLITLASARLGATPVGGLSKDKTEQHFAQAFDGSVARVLLCILDPKGEAGPSSDIFMTIAAGGHLCITDAPCGAGAASLALLSCLADLRSTGILPRTRLDVDVIGGELSSHARDIAVELLDEIRPNLASQAIFINYSMENWNVTDPVSNADLIKRSVRSGDDFSRRLIVVANFSGFLERERKRKDALPQLEELFRFHVGKNTLGLWIEPRTNSAVQKGGLFAWLMKLVTGDWKRFAGAAVNSDNSEPVSHYESESRFELPVTAPNSARVNLAVACYRIWKSTDASA